MKSLINIAWSIFSLSKAFDLVANGDDSAAKSLLSKKRFSYLKQMPDLLVSIEYDLLSMFLDMETGKKVMSHRIIRRIRSSSLSSSEKNFLIRYAISVIWVSRRQEGQCLLKIRHGLGTDTRGVSQGFQSKFASPDLPEPS
jgi:hypothetical protein